MKESAAAHGAMPAVDAHLFRMTDREFGLFQSLIEHEVGIQLPDAKRALLIGRLTRRLRELHLSSFVEYYERVVGSRDSGERLHMIDLVCTNETHFFREPKQFVFLEEQVLPAWTASFEGRRKLRVWSAACSTGEEPYSIAMSLLARVPSWEIEILATDISTRALAKASAGLWSIEKAREIPEPYLKSFMLRGVAEHQGTMKAGHELRNAIRFERLNLHSDQYDVGEPFDLIFCRNVLIYFNNDGRASVVRKLMGHLNPGGYLFVGHAETLNRLTDRLRLAGPGAYTWDLNHWSRANTNAHAVHEL